MFDKTSKPPSTGVLLGYARISKGDDQNNLLQVNALRTAGCTKLFEESASGGRFDRPVLHQMLDGLQVGDTVVVWKLDRLSRSLIDVLRIMDRIAEAWAGFRSLTESLDTTTPAGRMLMQVVGSFAEFERSLIRERTLAGLAAARAAGRIGGRPRKLDENGRKKIAEAVLGRHQTGADAARQFGVSEATVSRIVAAYRIERTTIVSDAP